ncbi:uncharacterized protein ACR2FA_009636 [Aphomia sociella]
MTYDNKVADSSDDYRLKIFKLTSNLLVHILIGITVGITILYAFRNGLPLSGINMHIVLCVIGYQLLMAQGFLALIPENSWSSTLRLVDKRRAHWVLQVMGSGLAIAGSFIAIGTKNVHWNTLHGQFALVALVFTTVSLVNGLTSLYSYELSKLIRIPPNFSKIPHICFGIVAFGAASISLCYGFDKNGFRNWIYPELAITAIVFTATFTFIYQLLMAEGFLCLVPENSWTTSFRLVDKRRIHWILQVMGSGLAIAGCFLVIPLKDIHWNSLHGKYALVALVFTIVSLVNGLTSLYSYELRKYLRIPPNFSRIPHILDGVVAFAAASMSLCYGLDMEFFRVWLSPYLSTIAIVFTATFTFIIIINPMTVVYNKIMDIYRK